MRGKPIEPGCLAMIVGSRGCPENNGRVVRVLRRMVAGEMGVNGLLIHTRYPFAWLVEAFGQPLTLITTSRKRMQVMQRLYAPKHLIRLDDDETPEEAHTTEQHKEQV